MDNTQIQRVLFTFVIITYTIFSISTNSIVEGGHFCVDCGKITITCPCPTKPDGFSQSIDIAGESSAFHLKAIHIALTYFVVFLRSLTPTMLKVRMNC